MDPFERELKVGFLDEAKDLLDNVEQCFLDLERAKDDPSIVEQIFRLAHNLKGSAGAVGFDDLKDFTHKFESLLLKIKNKELEISSGTMSLLLRCKDYLAFVIDELKSNLASKQTNPELVAEIQTYLDGQIPFVDANDRDTNKNLSPHEFQSHSRESAKPITPTHQDVVAPVPTVETKATSQTTPQNTSQNAEENIRVSLAKVDQLLNMMGELVILQTVMDQQKQLVPSILIQKTIAQMSKGIKEAQSISMSLRMLPLKNTFQKMQRIVRDTSKALGKTVDLEIKGEETEIDKTVLEQLGDPLVHLVRNAVDHGLESPEDRVAKGKSAVGRIELSAFQRGGQIVIEIRDDGKGLDPHKLIAKAKEKNILATNESPSDEEAYKLIFAPGFSTKEQVTDVSGRGVGMDVVKTNIAMLKGDIEIETGIGKGTCFRVLLPTTLAIIDGMVVCSGEARYVIPIAQINESVRPRLEDLESVANEGEVLCLRGRALPLYRLDHLLKRRVSPKKSATDCIALIFEDAGRNAFAVLVHDIINEQQVVIKNLGEEIKDYRGISGAAILGDGKATLILDLFELSAPIRNLKQQSRSDRFKGVA